MPWRCTPGLAAHCLTWSYCLRIGCAQQERLPQSDIRSAYQKASLNGDGFGVGWYVTNHAQRAISDSSFSILRSVGASQQSAQDAAAPDGDTAANDDVGFQDDGGACVFTSLKPAWADRNLYNLAEKVGKDARISRALRDTAGKCCLLVARRRQKNALAAMFFDVRTWSCLA